MKDLIMFVGGIVAVLLMVVGCGLVTCAHNEIGCYMMTAGMCCFPIIIWASCSDNFDEDNYNQPY